MAGSIGDKSQTQREATEAAQTGPRAKPVGAVGPNDVNADSHRPSLSAPDPTLRLGSDTRDNRPDCASERFADEGELARGGMSSVRKVYDRLLMRRIAVKALEGPATKLAHFLEEAQIHAQLEHPNIVPIYDMEQDATGIPHHIAMKLVRGTTLHELMHRTGSGQLFGTVLEQMLQVFLKVCDAIAFAHSRGVVHRDIKPSNIMVGTHGQVYVMDWGIACLRPQVFSDGLAPDPGPIRLSTSDFTAEAPGTLTGTPAFMAPEQAHGRVDLVDCRTDVYGLGGILYFLLTLNGPHQGGTVHEELARARAGQITAPTAADGAAPLPPGLCRIALRALSRAREDRHPTVEALRADVEDFLHGGGWLRPMHFRPGDTIVAEGDDGRDAYIITSGRCSLHKARGAELRYLRSLGSGEVFGEMAVFGSTRRTATVRATTDVSVLVVTPQALDQELDRKVWLRSMMEAMADRFVQVDRRVAELEEQLARYRAQQPD